MKEEKSTSSIVLLALSMAYHHRHLYHSTPKDQVIQLLKHKPTRKNFGVESHWGISMFPGESEEHD